MSLVTQLKALGYEGTAADLKTFEAAVGVTDAKVEAALAAAVAQKQKHPDTFQVGTKDDRIRAAEEQLEKLGFQPGDKDGVMDAALADAIAAFKAQHPELANVGRYLGTGASAAIAKAATQKSLVIGEISAKAWAELYPRLLADLKSGKIPQGTPISIGTYGIDKKMGEDIAQLKAAGANVHFAPVFGLVQKDRTKQPWAGKPGGTGFDGPVPPYGEMSDAQRYAWGKEIGRRMRDQIAAAQAKGIAVDGWQLDEIWPSANKPDGGLQIRELMRGVLDGLRSGRDGTQMKGTVYIGNLPGLVKAEQTPELKQFWQSLNAASSQIFQEEYPVFGKAGPVANAKNANDADAKLATLGPAGAALAKKIVSGMSPGYAEGALHGQWIEDGKNADGSRHYRSLGLTPQQVAKWREAYMKAREAAGVVGLGEFGFAGGNADPNVIASVLAQLERELRG